MVLSLYAVIGTPISAKNDFWTQFCVVPAIGGPAGQDGPVVVFGEKEVLLTVRTERKLGSGLPRIL